MARLPKSIIKKYGITKKAWRVFRSRKRSTTRASPKSKPKKRRRNLARKRKRRRTRTRDKRIPILVTGAGAVKSLVEPIFGNDSWSGAKAFAEAGDIEGAVKEFLGCNLHNFTGYRITDGQFDFQKPLQTYTLLITAWVGSKLATKFGVNRALKRVPFVGKYIKL